MSSAVQFEMLATINCFFFEVPKASECFEIHQDQLVRVLHRVFLPQNESSVNLKLMAFRVMRNLLNSKVISVKDLHTIKDRVIQTLDDLAGA
jgi:hypothetical protein